MSRIDSHALDRCPICGIPRADAKLDVYGRWCVDRDGCSRRWLERQKSSPHRLAFRPPEGFQNYGSPGNEPLPGTNLGFETLQVVAVI
jgi:hypothetical protein